MNFVNNIVRNLEHLDHTASEISRETDGDLKETIAKNIPIVTNKVKEITARGFSAEETRLGNPSPPKKLNNCYSTCCLTLGPDVKQ